MMKKKRKLRSLIIDRNSKIKFCINQVLLMMAVEIKERKIKLVNNSCTIMKKMMEMETFISMKRKDEQYDTLMLD
jgi:hypothetical protein